MIRFLAALSFSFALVACFPAPPPLPSKAEWDAQHQQQAQPQGLASMPKGEAFAPTGGAEDDSDFRGPMQLVELPKSADGAARFAFIWMDGRHVVTATEVGAAEGGWRIDGKLTLARALAAAPNGKIMLLQVDDENGPNEDPDYTPLCGVRMVNLIALYRDGDKLALATTSSSFQDGNTGGCSNAISYARKQG